MQNDRPVRKNPHRRRKFKWGRLLVLLIVIGILLSFLLIGIKTIVKDPVALGSEVIHYFRNWNISLNSDRQTEDQVTNILVLGLDEGLENPTQGRCCDFLMVISYQKQDPHVHFFSLPPDTLLQRPGRSFLLKNSYSKEGPQFAVQAVQEVLHIPIHHYIVITREGFAQIIDQMGGFPLYVEKDMKYNKAGSEPIDLQRGYQFLSGDNVYQYVRFKTDDLQEIGRINRQQRILRLLPEQLFRWDRIFEAPFLLPVIEDNIQTDMDRITFVKVINQIRIKAQTGIQTEILAGNTHYVEQKNEYIPNSEKSQNQVKEIFLPKKSENKSAE